MFISVWNQLHNSHLNFNGCNNLLLETRSLSEPVRPSGISKSLDKIGSSTFPCGAPFCIPQKNENLHPEHRYSFIKSRRIQKINATRPECRNSIVQRWPFLVSFRKLKTTQANALKWWNDGRPRAQYLAH